MLALAFAQHREALVDAIEVRAYLARTAPPMRTEQKIVANVHVREDAAALGNHNDAAGHDPVDVLTVEAVTVEPDFAAGRPAEARCRTEDARLSRAVGTHERDDFPLAKRDRHATDRNHAIVADDEVPGLEVRAHAPNSSSSAPR